MITETRQFEWTGGTVTAAWHRPARGKIYLVLAHGAGGNLHTPGLAELAEVLWQHEIGVVRFNFPYAESKRKVPDPQPLLEDCYRSISEHVRTEASQLFLGGRSMGGRIASHIVAKGAVADGLVLLSYPLHPPGQPERLRTRHLPKITTPMLFIQGSRDTFARPDLLKATLATLPRATLHVVDGADHGLKVKGRTSDSVIHEVADIVAAWIGRQ
jgi:predicted alpha/beta-hydrolase family hydrolase